MTLLESGPARTDRLYWLIVGIVFLAFFGYFIYDGAYGYPRENRKRAETDLLRWTDLPDNPTERAKTLDKLLGPKPTEKDFNELRDKRPALRQEVIEALGNPVPRGKGSPPDQPEVFAGQYGMVSVPIDSQGRVDAAHMQWRAWGKSAEKIQEQFYWAIVPAVGALYFFYRSYKAATLRASIDEDGLTYGGLRIPFADMVSFRDYNRKGWVDLYYKSGDDEKRLRIDNQKIAKFDEIAGAICEKTGFPNPLLATESEAEPEEDEAQPDTAQDESAGDKT